MRLSLFAGVAALGAAAVDFEDDDIQFLRLLSSNMSANGTQGMATTGSSSMMTTMMATTGSSSMGNTTTTAAATTTTGGSSGNGTTSTAPAASTTTAPATTTGGSSMTDGPTTTMKPIETACSAASYSALGMASMAPPVLLTSVNTADLYFHVKGACTEGDTPTKTTKCVSAEKCAKEWGADALTTANTAKCSSGVSYTCANLVTMLNAGDVSKNWKKMGLDRCCLSSPASAIHGPTDLGGTAVTGGNFEMQLFSDSTCATALTAAPALKFMGDGTFPVGAGGFAMTEAKKTIAMGSCAAYNYYGGGSYMKISACNRTSGTAAMTAGDQGNWKFFKEHFIDSGCQYRLAAVDEDQHFCSAQSDQLSSNGTLHLKAVCSGGTEVANKVIQTAISTDVTVSASTTCEVVTTLLTVMGTEIKVQVAAAAGSDATSVVLKNGALTSGPKVSCAGVSNISRRLESRGLRARRRLSGHSQAAFVTETVMPAAKAGSVKTLLDTAKSGSGVLSVATLQTAVAAKVAADTTLAAGNFPVTVNSVAVSEPAIQLPQGTTTGGGGSTSGAATNVFGLGFGVAALLMSLF